MATIFQYLNEEFIGNIYTPWDWEGIRSFQERDDERP